MKKDASNRIDGINTHLIAASLAFTLVVVLSLAYNLRQHEATMISMATIQARTAYNKDLAYRKWNVQFGGIYAPETVKLPPNPYLEGKTEREVVTSTGRVLTQINAAYMNRLVHQIEDVPGSVSTRLTSLKPVRPENAPDQWEAEALNSLELGSPEAIGVKKINGDEYLRLMKPLYVEKTCLDCHFDQGYALGDVRGGISVKVPLGDMRAAGAGQKDKIWLAHIGLWLLGMAFLVIRNRDIKARADAIIMSEREAKLAQRAAEAASQAKTDFLTNISHEIRTPMNSIIGMSQLAMEMAVNNEQRTYLYAVNKSATALLDIINDLLDLSKVEADRMELHVTDFCLSELVHGIMEMFKPSAIKKNIRFSYRIDPDLPDELRGDPVRLRQVMVNLLGNAVKFTHNGGVNMIVERQKDGSGESMNGGEDKPGAPVKLLFKVVDTGIGIPLEKLDGIFETFAQADASTSRMYGGTGLGLSISRRLVELMGGRLYVDSVPGEGSVFYFTAMFEKGTVRQICAPPRPDEPAVENGVNILLVEDNPFNQMLTVKILEKRGHRVDVASSGAEALEFLSGGDYQVVIMDIQMPGMDGVETTRRIREGEAGAANKQIPIIAMTAHAMESHREKYLGEGMDDFVAKPVDSRALTEAVARNTRA